ncbi:MAG: acyl-CoA thioesterase [Chloroherpetonaceae bacterium]|nr:acyl-CoA thioesterase [Chloroherpetonaceae bacterium]MDW8437052.1 thioesterase family protein [Chloroherpetonaceae bacterium]
MRKHETRLKVRSYELDFFQHVNNAVYLNYIEQARVELLQSAGFSLEEFFAQKILPVVVNVNINYRRPSRLNDELVIFTHVSRIGTSSFAMRHEAYNLTSGNAPSFDADVTHAVIDIETGKSTPIPDRLRQQLASLHLK